MNKAEKMFNKLGYYKEEHTKLKIIYILDRRPMFRRIITFTMFGYPKYHLIEETPNENKPIKIFENLHLAINQQLKELELEQFNYPIKIYELQDILDKRIKEAENLKNKKIKLRGLLDYGLHYLQHGKRYHYYQIMDFNEKELEEEYIVGSFFTVNDYEFGVQISKGE